MPVDRRVWYPDESCTPFFISASIAAIASGEIARFFVPENNLLVIRSGIVGVTVNANVKSSVRVILTDRDEPAVPDMPGVKIEGAVQQPQTLDITGLDNPGFACLHAASRFDCAIILQGGRIWRAIKQGALATPVTLLLSGYVFPLPEV